MIRMGICPEVRNAQNHSKTVRILLKVFVGKIIRQVTP